jgi:hypothetical protein
VTAVGTAGVQDALAAPAAAGATSIQVLSTVGIAAGDTILLDIGARQETVTVASVGSAGAAGTGVTLIAALRFAHSANLPFSDRGTGISFTPAARFAHSSDEPVRALGGGITLNQPLSRRSAVDAAVIDTDVTGAGYQGAPAPDQWFGGPALSSSAGSMVLRDARGLTADSLDYGGLVDPALQEGYQGASGTGRVGCFAPTPPPGFSTARGPGGADTDSNCTDFAISATPTPGASN